MFSVTIASPAILFAFSICQVQVALKKSVNGQFVLILDSVEIEYA